MTALWRSRLPASRWSASSTRQSISAFSDNRHLSALAPGARERPGWLVAVTFSYAMNSFITFGPESGRILRWRDYASFAAVGHCRNGFEHSDTVRAILPCAGAACEAGVDPVSFAVNFSLSHFVVFRVRRPRDNAG
jgi:hypothetical protein